VRAPSGSRSHLSLELRLRNTDHFMSRRATHACAKLMCWKRAAGPSEQIAVEAGHSSSMIVIEDQSPDPVPRGLSGIHMLVDGDRTGWGERIRTREYHRKISV
jgi:hypothetical protein